MRPKSNKVRSGVKNEGELAEIGTSVVLTEAAVGGIEVVLLIFKVLVVTSVSFAALADIITASPFYKDMDILVLVNSNRLLSKVPNVN